MYGCPVLELSQNLINFLTVFVFVSYLIGINLTKHFADDKEPKCIQQSHV